HRRRRRRGATQDRARPARRRAAAARLDGARGADRALPRRGRSDQHGPVPRAPRRGAVRSVGRAARARARHPSPGADPAGPPAAPTERGLAAAIAALAARAPVPVELIELPDDRLPSVVETTAYFTVSEALTNVAKYAQASRATVRLAEEDDALVVEVRDDGVGGARASTGPGLSGLTDRLGGRGGPPKGDNPPGGGALVPAAPPLPNAGPAGAGAGA